MLRDAIKLPPFDPAIYEDYTIAYTEEALLGAILIAPDTCLPYAAETLAPSDFSLPAGQAVFEGILQLREMESPIDILTLADRLDVAGKLEEAGGLAGLSFLADRLPSGAACHPDQWTRRVKEASLYRELRALAASVASDPTLDQADSFAEVAQGLEAKIAELRQQDVSKGGTRMSDILRGVMRQIEDLAQGRPSPALATGFRDLDDLTSGGFWPSELVILAARPSMGKSAFALNLALRVAKEKKGVLFFSLEMPESMIGLRLLAAESGVSVSSLKRGIFSEADTHKTIRGAASLSQLPIFVDDSPTLTPALLRRRTNAQIQEWAKNGTPPGLIVVDYLGKMSTDKKEAKGGGEEARVAEVSAISSALQKLAREVKTPILALSQLNRSLEHRPNKRPILSDLRDSGSLEQDADTILFVYRDEVYNPDTDQIGLAEVIIGKQRNGPLGTAKLQWRGEIQRFDDL